MREDTEQVAGERGRHRDYVKHSVHMEFSKIKFKLETTLNRLEYIFLQRILRILDNFCVLSAV